jgi:hypothetical protein
LGASIGFNDVRLLWTGDDERLANALDDSEAVHSTVSPGVAFGRTWLSGWGLSTGVFLERSERYFEHTERSSTVETALLTYIVTLNTQVFVSNVDTVESVSTTERHTSGVNRRTALRIPFEASWQRRARRWSYGLRAGAAVEFTRAEHALSLDLQGQDGRLVATDLSGEAIDGRYPTALLLTAGLEVGYLFHERWSLHAGPAYMRGVTPLEDTAPVHALPERLGLQFGLVHHFDHGERTR